MSSVLVLSASQTQAALATVNEILVVLVFGRQGLLFVSHVYEQLVTIHPIVKFAEFFNYLVLYFVNAWHCDFIFRCK